MKLIARSLAPGGHNEQFRSYLRTLANETWDLVNWLTHASNASHFDGVVALDAVAHLLGTYSMASVRQTRGEPKRCPECGSYQMTVDFRGFEDEALTRAIEFDLCEACGWEERRATVTRVPKGDGN